MIHDLKLSDISRLQRRVTHKQLIQLLSAPEFHWHFYQGIEALNARLYIPGCISLLAGIETSIRCTLFRIENLGAQFYGEDLGTLLSNRLLREAQIAGLPVESLAFPDENNFIVRLQCNKPPVTIVEIRNALAHGNITEYINKVLGLDQHFFTPECLRKDAHLLRHISVRWCRKLAVFRHKKFGEEN